MGLNFYATKCLPNISVLEIFAKEYNISCFRGSENNVLERVINAGKKANADIIVEITGDCPIIDPSIVDQTIKIFINNNVHFVSNNHIRSYPDGMDVQVFKLQTLIKSSKLSCLGIFSMFFLATKDQLLITFIFIVTPE